MKSSDSFEEMNLKYWLENCEEEAEAEKENKEKIDAFKIQNDAIKFNYQIPSCLYLSNLK